MKPRRSNSTDANCLPVLPQIEINSPCPMNWDEMDGDLSRRFCGHCQKHVHNFDEMATDDVNELLASGQNICAKITRRPDGTVVTKSDDLAHQPVSRRNWLVRFGAMAASLLALITLGGCRDNPSGEMPGVSAQPPGTEAPMLMGEVCLEELGDVAVLPEAQNVEPMGQVKILGKVGPAIEHSNDH